MKARFGVNGGDMTLRAGNGMLSGGTLRLLQVMAIQTWADHYFWYRLLKKYKLRFY